MKKETVKVYAYDKYFRTEVDKQYKNIKIIPVKNTIVHGPWVSNGEKFFSFYDKERDGWETCDYRSGLPIGSSNEQFFYNAEDWAIDSFHRNLAYPHISSDASSYNGIYQTQKEFSKVASLIKRVSYREEGIVYTEFRNTAFMENLFNFDGLSFHLKYNYIKEEILKEENPEALSMAYALFKKKREEYLRASRNKTSRNPDVVSKSLYFLRSLEDLKNSFVKQILEKEIPSSPSDVTVITDIADHIRKEQKYDDNRGDDYLSLIDKMPLNYLTYLLKQITDNGKYLPFYSKFNRYNQIPDIKLYSMIFKISSIIGSKDGISNSMPYFLLECADPYNSSLVYNLYRFYNNIDKEMVRNLLNTLIRVSKEALKKGTFVNFSINPDSADPKRRFPIPLFAPIEEKDYVPFEYDGIKLNIVKHVLYDEPEESPYSDFYIPHFADSGKAVHIEEPDLLLDEDKDKWSDMSYYSSADNVIQQLKKYFKEYLSADSIKSIKILQKAEYRRFQETLAFMERGGRVRE